MQQTNNTGAFRGWTWTGNYTKNQMWSYFKVTEPIEIDSIDILWGGYDAPTRGRHFIAKWTAGNGKKLGGLVVQSGMINVSQGRKWRRANVRKTLLQPGSYAVGIWGHYIGRRIVQAHAGKHGGSSIYTYQNSYGGSKSPNYKANGKFWRNKPGVIPARLNGKSPNNVRVKVGNTWRTGEAFVKVGSSWRRAKGVYVKVGNSWRRANG